MVLSDDDGDDDGITSNPSIPYMMENQNSAPQLNWRSVGTQHFISTIFFSRKPSPLRYNHTACHCTHKWVSFIQCLGKNNWFFPTKHGVILSLYKTWLKIVLSIASGLAQRIIIIIFTSFDKASLHTLSYISPCFARGIPHSFLEPARKLDVS